MANTFSFEEALRPAPKSQQPQTFSFEEALKPAAPTTFSFEDAIAKKEPTPEEQSIFRQVADVPLQLQKGFVSGVRLLADAFGADSSTSKNLRDVEEHLAGLMSAQSKKDSAEMARIMKDAEDKGIVDQVGAGLKALSVAPVDTVVNAFGTTGPILIAGLAGGMPGVAIAGATMGAGTVKGAIYETVKEELTKAGYKPADAEARAVKAQDYFGDNTGMIATGAGLGVLESITGAQPALLRLMGRKLAVESAEDIAKKSLAGAAFKGAFKEATPEFLQGGQEQLARNLALQNEGFDVPTMRGVVTQGTLEAGAGAIIGGITSPVDLAAQQQKVSQLEQRITNLQNTPPPPGSDEERVLQRAAELEARGNIDRQSAMIVAMNEIATEKRLSEKVDGPKPPEQTGEAPLFIFNTPEEAQERTRLLKLNHPKSNFAIQDMGDGKFGIFKIPVDTTGAANVTAPISETGGAGAAMPSPAGMGGAALGAGESVGGGLDDAGVAAGALDGGAGAQRGALEGGQGETTATTLADTVPIATPDTTVGAAQPTVSSTDAEALETSPAATPDQRVESQINYDDGGTYVGTTLNGVLDGRGVLTFPNGARYEGDFKNGKTDGRGTLTYADGSTYVGEFKEGYFNGQGTVTFSDGRVVSGIFENNVLITEEPSVAETPEAVETEAQGQEQAAAAAAAAEPIAEEVITAIDDVNTATEEVSAAITAREEDKATREKGKGEPAALRRAQRDADEKLETAIVGTTGTGGMLGILKDLQVRIANAEQVLRMNLARTADPTKAENVGADEALKPIEDSLVSNRNDLELGLTNLFEFASNPKFEGRASHKAAIEFLSGLDEATKDRLYARGKRRAELEFAQRGGSPTVEATFKEQQEDRAQRRADKQMLDEAIARAEAMEAGVESEVEAETEAKPAPTVTTKKRRKVELPGVASASAKARQRSAAGLFSPTEIEKNRTPDYKSRDKLIEMPIDEFLALADEGRVESKIKDAVALLDKGIKFRSLPILIVGTDGKVSGHEGRHRAMALRERGYTTMPVILRSDNIRWSEQLDPDNFDYRPFPDTLQAQDKAANPRFTVPFPIAREDSVTPYTADTEATSVISIPPAAQQRKMRRSLATSLQTDTTFEQLSGLSVTESLKHIAATGNPFERALATRLLARDNRAGVRDTKLYVVTPEDVEAMAKTEASMEGANGLYYMDKNGDYIFLRGSEFGTGLDDNGINNQTVLHEALHATVNKRIIYATFARSMGLPVSPALESLVVELNDLMDRAGLALDQYIEDNKEIPYDIQELIDGGAFSNITEFVAYGMTDATMQKFLRQNVEGVVTRTNGLSDFVRLILDMLGLGPEHTSGLRDLIEYTNKLAATVHVDPQTARTVLDKSKENRELDLQATSKAAKKSENKSQGIQDKIETSASADQLVEDLGSLANVVKNPKLWGEYLSMNLSNINFSGLNALLAILPTNMVVELGSNKGITRLDEVDKGIREMSTMRTKMQTRVQDIATPWIKLSAPVQKQLGKVMSYATLARIDPAKDKGVDKTLDDMYKALPQEAKDVYVAARDFYADTYALYRALLEQAAERMGADAQTLASVRALYEVANNKGPYFPLMRFGQFWARIGKGDTKEFYMFESAGLRDVFIKRRMEELAAKGEKRTFEKMIEEGDADRGNDVNALRENMVKDSVKLQNMFKLIDNSATLGDEKARAMLKDQVYQMYLLTLPEASMRKHFIHRKGVTGFSGDALRNFLNSGTRMSNQLARVRYGADINNAIDMSRESLKGNPEKDKLEAIVKEMELRTADELNPPIDDTFMEKLARNTNKVAFLWLLTSVKSAANQMFSVVNFTLPTLAARYGWGNAMFEMGKYLALGYGQLGTVKKLPDGTTTWVAPTIGLSDRVAKNPEEQRAYQRMQDMGISDMTRTYDLFLRRGAPSVDYNSRWAAVTNTMGALFHHSERISREITFMSSFRLAKQSGQTFEQAIDSATRDVNTALFDYSAWNRPRALRAAPVRVVTQFKQFPMYVTLYLARNGYQLIKAGATAQERKEAASMLFGTLGFTALLAGTAGLPTYSLIMGIIQGIRNALRDDDEEDPLPEMDTELWFRNIFLPEFFGDNTIMGMKLSELIDSGLLNTATGYDVASGVSLNNMWFHDTPDANNWKGAFDSTMISIMGPGASVARNWVASVDDFNNGQYLKGMEKLSPAFFRGGITATRFGTEGALATTGAEIKGADDFTYAQLVAQTMGYKTTGLAQIMNNNFVIQQKVNGLKNERAGLLKQLDIAFESGNDSDVESILDDIDNFSGRYPSYKIKPSEISASMKAREKVRRKSEAGLYLDKRARDFADLRERAISNLEAETEK
jgi:hypothetical protein